jgi:hypothetical protein
MAANAKFLEDVTIPDKTAILAGTAFTKTWLVQNNGDVAWTPGFQLVYDNGGNLASTSTVPLPACAPGQQVQISIAMTAPARKGRCKSTWVFRNSQGEVFGEHLYVLIEVKPVTNTVGQKNNYFVADVTIPDDSAIQPGASFLKTWRIRNTGTVAWTDRYTLNMVSGTLTPAQKKINVPPVAPGGEVNLSVSFKAPKQPGKYNADWKMKDERGQFFGVNLWTSIVVPGATTGTASGTSASLSASPAAAQIKVEASAPHYCQRDTTWGNINLGHVANAPTIARWGCMMTSFAMLASTMERVVNPAQLNELMVQKGGFLNGYLTRWNALQIVFGDIIYETKLDGGQEMVNRINACLQAGRAVPVQVDLTPANSYSDSDQHWVLVVGRNEGDYWMQDPYNYDAAPTSLMKRYGRPGGNLGNSILSAIFYRK